MSPWKTCRCGTRICFAIDSTSGVTVPVQPARVYVQERETPESVPVLRREQGFVPHMPLCSARGTFRDVSNRSAGRTA